MREFHNSHRLLKKAISISLWFCLFLYLGFWEVPSAFAQVNSPPWRENLNCLPREEQIYQGLEFCTARIMIEGMGSRRAHIVVVDLFSPGVSLQYVIAEGYARDNTFGPCRDVNVPKNSTGPGCYTNRRHPDWYPVMSLPEAARRFPNTAVVINSDYGAGDHGNNAFRGHGPEGFAVIGGNRIDGPNYNDFDEPGSTDPDDNNAVRRPWLAISQIPPLHAEIGQIPEGDDNGGKYREWIYTGVGGGPWIIQDGKVVGPWMTFDGVVIDDVKALCDITNPGSCYAGANQTSVGLSEDGRWLFLAIVYIETPNLDFTTKLMSELLQAWQAIKLDGGGSSQLWYGGRPNSQQNVEAGIVERGDGRQLSQYLAVLANPGSGISEPLPHPPERPNLWDGLRQLIQAWWAEQLEKINQWWEEQQNRIDEWINQQLEELLKQIEVWLKRAERQAVEWMLRRLEDWLTQCLGSLILPLGIAILLWIWNYGKNKP